MGTFSVAHRKPQMPVQKSFKTAMLRVVVVVEVQSIPFNLFLFSFLFHSLQDHMFILNLNTEGQSWWRENGYNCSSTFNMTSSLMAGGSNTQLLAVEGCLLDYTYIEVIHAAIQCIFCVSMNGTQLVEPLFSVLITSLMTGESNAHLLAVEGCVLDYTYIEVIQAAIYFV